MVFFKKQTNVHLVIVGGEGSSYHAALIAHDKSSELFFLKGLERFEVCKGEFGPSCFINHTLLFSAVCAWVSSTGLVPMSAAFLAGTSFIDQNPLPFAPYMLRDGLYVSLPFLFQCRLFGVSHRLPLTIITSIDHAYAQGVDYTKHLYCSETINRLIAKTAALHALSHDQERVVIASCGSYRMEYL